MRLSQVAVVATLCVTSLMGGIASADEGAAALLPFQGPQAGKLRQSVQSGLRSMNVRLVPLQQVNAVVKKTKDQAKQAARLDAQVLVTTRVRRVEGRWIADTQVHNAKGASVEKLRTSSSSLSRLSNRIVAGLMETGLMPTAEGGEETGPPEPTKPRLVVRPFKGAQAAKVRGAVVRGLLKEEVELYPNAKFAEEAKRLGVSLQSDGGHVAPASSLAVSGLFEGDVLREDGMWSAYVRLVEGRSASVAKQNYYDATSLNGLIKKIQSRVGPDFFGDIEKLGVAVPAAVAVAPATPVPAVEKVPELVPVVAESKPKEPTKKRPEDRPAAVDIEVDFRITHRTFRYNDVPDFETNLRDYKLKVGPGIALNFQYFPGAHFTDGVGAQFGIDFNWDRLFDFESTRASDGASFPTQSQQFLIGLRWRYPINRWEPFVVIDYGVHDFEFGVSGPPSPGEDNTAGVPSVRYQFVRFGGGFRVELGKKDMFILGANIALRGVFDVGALGTYVWFPNANANGMDAGLLFGIALPLGFEVRIGGDYRRYWFDLNPEPPAAYVAGGALDQYLSGTIGLAWRR